MKLIVAIGLVFLLAGCGSGWNTDADPQFTGGTVYVITDIKTGCEYIARGNGNGGLTARLKPNGQPWCVSVASK